MLGLVRAFDGHADVVSLLFGELGQLAADLLQVQAGDFLVELLRKDVNAGLVFLDVLPELDLGEDLVECIGCIMCGHRGRCSEADLGEDLEYHYDYAR